MTITERAEYFGTNVCVFVLRLPSSSDLLNQPSFIIYLFIFISFKEFPFCISVSFHSFSYFPRVSVLETKIAHANSMNAQLR